MGASIYLGTSLSAGTKGCNIILPTTTPFTGLLDTYPGAAVGYSLRRLSSTYTGNAIRVRRSSDNTEQNIGFVGNELDTTTMLDFVGYNLLTYSEDITQQLVGGGRATYTNNVEISPDSNITGGKFATDGTFGEHYWFRNAVTILNSTSYNISVYLKQADFTKVRVSSNISGSAQNCDVDLTNGNVTNNGFANTPVVTAEANGWYRFSVTITSGTTSASPISIRLYNTSGAISFVGDAGKGVYVWGAQLSQTSTVKTYQKTVATVAGNGFITTWYDQSTNANNATQATAASQAQIVASGAVITDPNTGKISVTWTADFYTFTGVAVTQTMLMSAVVNRTLTNNALAPLGTTSANPYLFSWSSTGNIVSRIGATATTHESTNTTVGAYIVSALRDGSDVVKAFRNTTALTTGTNTGTGIDFIRFGTAAGFNTTGRMVEMIHWNNDKESSRADIVTNQNTYWDAY